MSGQLTLFAGDTPVSHSATPGSAEARTMTATSGRKCVGSWLPSGPLGACLKTLLVTSAWGSTKCFLTWRTKATPANRLLFQLAPSMPRTDATEFGLLPTAVTFYSREDWPTPHANCHMGAGEHGEGGDNLQTAVAFWQTPNVPNGGRVNPVDMSPTGKMPDGRKRQVGLEHQVRMVERGLWPTPIANDAEKRGIPKVGAGQAGAVHMVPTPTTSMCKGSSGGAMTRKSGRSRENDRLDYKIEGADPVTNGRLNPTWVELLMGFPPGWTEVTTEKK